MSLFKEINSEHKLRLTLTLFAMNTLHEDEIDFNLSIATMLNRIITYYSAEADASVSIKLMKYEKKMKSVLGDGNDETVKKLIAAEEKALIASVPKYDDTPQSFVFRINNANMFFLTQDVTSCEDRYYKKGMKPYIEALVEEFCRLPFIEREKIYCSEVYNALNSAIKTETAVYIFHNFGKKYLMRVFEITTDPLNTYHYVIARLIDTKGGRMNDRIYTLRLSRISRVMEKPSVSGAFTTEEKKKNALAVSKSGVQFLGDKVCNIVVEFTDKGLKNFSTQLHLRPHVTKIREDGHTYEFECTNTQAIYYFKKLGASAKVIKPAFVRKELAKWYREAAEMYLK